MTETFVLDLRHSELQNCRLMMHEKETPEQDEIFSKSLRAGRRTYFFDVRATKAGDYYLTITESKKETHDDGSFQYRKHKIYLYKEDFEHFKELVNEMTQFIYEEKGQEVISEIHQPDFHKTRNAENNYTKIDFEDI